MTSTLGIVTIFINLSVLSLVFKSLLIITDLRMEYSKHLYVMFFALFERDMPLT